MVGVAGRSGGWNRKTTAEHITNGSYRADRHGDRVDVVAAVGEPEKPEGLTPIQSDLWDEVVNHYPPGVLCRIDTVGLLGLVQWYRLFDESMKLAEADLMNREAMRAAKTSWDHFSKLAIEYGLTPAARARLQVVPPKPAEDDPFLEIIARKKRAL